jgi:hypothetical protein
MESLIAKNWHVEEAQLSSQNDQTFWYPMSDFRSLLSQGSRFGKPGYGARFGGEIMPGLSR